MIDRSTTRDIPHFPVALYEVAILFGTLVAETILASVHVRAHKQAGHMDASDLIKALQNTLRGGGRPHMENRQSYSFGGLPRLDLPSVNGVSPRPDLRQQASLDCLDPDRPPPGDLCDQIGRRHHHDVAELVPEKIRLASEVRLCNRASLAASSAEWSLLLSEKKTSSTCLEILSIFLKIIPDPR